MRIKAHDNFPIVGQTIFIGVFSGIAGCEVKAVFSVIIADAIGGGIAFDEIAGGTALRSLQIGGNSLAANYLEAGSRSFPSDSEVVIVKVFFVNHFKIVLFPLFHPDTGTDLLGILVPLVDTSSARYGGDELFFLGLCVR